MRILNLGAGNDIIADAVNHDLHKHRSEIELTFDLNLIPYPLKSATWDKVVIKSVIEHLIPTPLETMAEIWRILKPNGIVIVKYPLYTSPTIHDDPTHRWFLSERSLDYLDPTTPYGVEYGYYSKAKFKIISKNKHKNMSIYVTLRKV